MVDSPFFIILFFLLYSFNFNYRIDINVVVFQAVAVREQYGFQTYIKYIPLCFTSHRRRSKEVTKGRSSAAAERLFLLSCCSCTGPPFCVWCLYVGPWVSFALLVFSTATVPIYNILLH